jgi:S-adenosylmethionine hydrolase
LRVRVDGDEHLASVAPSFAWAADGELVLYSDSSGRVGLAVNGGSAAERLRVGRDDELVIEA